MSARFAKNAIRNHSRQRGMVSQMLLFIVLILLANAAIFAPNIATLKEARRTQSSELHSRGLSVIASAIAKSTTTVNNILQPPPARTSAGTAYTTVIPMDSYGLMPENFRLMANGLNIGYCPHDYTSANPAVGYMASNEPVSGVAPPGEDPDTPYLNVTLFTLIMQGDTPLTCEQAINGSYSEQQVLNVKYSLVKAITRSAGVERANMAQIQNGCPAGQEAVYSAAADGGFSCQQTVQPFAAVPPPDQPVCPSGSALTPRSDGVGLSCASITGRAIDIVLQTVDTTRFEVGGAPPRITLVKPHLYFDARNPVTGMHDVPAIPNLENFNCPARYSHTSQTAYPGIRSQFVAVLNDNSLICIKSWTMLLTRQGTGLPSGPEFCPPGKKILWMPNTNNGRSFICEGSSASDPNWGLYTVCSQDGTEDTWGYSPETNQVYCYWNPNPAPQFDTTYTYPEKGATPCVTNGLVTVNNRVASCSETFGQAFTTTFTTGRLFHVNWAFNWDPARGFFQVSPTSIRTGGVVTVPAYIVDKYTSTLSGIVIHEDQVGVLPPLDPPSSSQQYYTGDQQCCADSGP